MSYIKCENCGVENELDAIFCKNCGKKINNKDKHTIKSGTLVVSIGVLLIGILVVFISAPFIIGMFIENNLSKTSSENTSSNTTQATDYITDEEKTSTSIKKIKVDDTVKINTDNGDFEIKIDNIKKSDWYNGSDKDCFVGLVECEVNNINFYDEWNPDGLWPGQYLVVTDQNNYLADDWNTGGDDGEYHALEQVPKGTRSKVAIPYVFTKNSKSAKININDKYYVTLDIK